MSIKDKLTSFLQSFGAKRPEEEEINVEQELGAEEPLEVPINMAEEALLELPRDHSMYRLYERRRTESGMLPKPRICLDEEEELPLDMVKKERNRLRSVLNSACTARWKEARGNEGRRRKKGEEEEEEKPPVLDALPLYFLSADKLYAWVIIFPPTGGGKEISREMLYWTMKEQGILYGVDTRLADHLHREDRRYFTLYLIARGKPAFDGKNGNIVDYFPRVIERILEIDEYDQVDYTALNMIRNVKEGQEICRLILPTEGEPGRTVLDQEIPAKSGKAVSLPQGRNTEISEDGITLVASIDGHVEFNGRSFQVKPVLDIQGNVDYSTGDINFLGDVNIQGDVLSGFEVRAMGNIHVGGVIEAGSIVEAGGDLVVVKGILGDGSTVVRSQKCIFTKYIENATIYVKENLQTDCIVNGSVYCDGEIVVRSGRGSIIGGSTWAAKAINARVVGSMSECKTMVSMGGLPCTSFERDMTMQEIEELEQELEKLENQLDSPVRESLLSKTRMKLSVAELKRKQLEAEMTNTKTPPGEKDSARMECGIAYAGTEIRFGEEMVRLRHDSRQCIAKMIHGEIVVM